jgi:hypothetical protein
MIMINLKTWNQFYNQEKAQKIQVEADKTKNWRKGEQVVTIIQIWIYKVIKKCKIEIILKIIYKTFNRFKMTW